MNTPKKVLTMRTDLMPKSQGPRPPVPPDHPTRRRVGLPLDKLEAKIVKRFNQPEEPTLVELAENFAGAMARWGDAGFRTLTREQYDVRGAACDKCDYWDPAARLGLGKCKAPGCGCTKLKRWLVSEQCKHPEGSRWPVLQPPAPLPTPPA